MWVYHLQGYQWAYWRGLASWKRVTMKTDVKPVSKHWVKLSLGELSSLGTACSMPRGRRMVKSRNWKKLLLGWTSEHNRDKIGEEKSRQTACRPHQGVWSFSLGDGKWLDVVRRERESSMHFGRSLACVWKLDWERPRVETEEVSEVAVEPE